MQRPHTYVTFEPTCTPGLYIHHYDVSIKYVGIPPTLIHNDNRFSNQSFHQGRGRERTEVVVIVF